MIIRRHFLKGMAAAVAGGGLASIGIGAAAQGARRAVTLDGQRIRTIDVHAHCFMPEVMDLIKNSPRALADVKGALADPLRHLTSPQRIPAMDAQGIDIQALSVNAFWYDQPHDNARAIVSLLNEAMATWCGAHRDRFVALACVSLQHPELAATELEDAVKKMGMRGVAIGGSVEGLELSDRRFDPFWAKVQELDALVFMHPQTVEGTTENHRLAGKGVLDNIIGNPLETTVFLSHLIFEGTLDRFPGLRICGSHGSGYLASYAGRSDALCARKTGVDCRNLKKKPSEYLKKEIFSDTVVFGDGNLKHLVAECGVGQILYGTDYPFDWPVGIDFVLKAPYLSAKDKAAILGGNAAKLLRLA